MPLRLDSQSADFPTRFRSLLAQKREATQDVEQAVRAIIADVTAQGDRALVALSLNLLFRIGIRRTVTATVDADAPYVQQVSDLIERQAGVWGARRDVTSRARR